MDTIKLSAETNYSIMLLYPDSIILQKAHPLMEYSCKKYHYGSCTIIPPLFSTMWRWQENKTNWQFSVFTEDSYRPIEHFLFSNTFCDRKDEGFKIVPFDIIILLERVGLLPSSLTNGHNDIFIILVRILKVYLLYYELETLQQDALINLLVMKKTMCRTCTDHFH